VHLLDLYIKAIIFLFAKMTKHFGINQLFPLLKYTISIS